MIIVFIENKHKTSFWVKIARRLMSDGHEIHWIVQNKLFTPSVGIVHKIPLPKANDLNYNAGFRELERKDRYCYIYEQIPLHYKYYNDQISDIVTAIKPELVFGESTLFHELLTIDICKKASVLYLHPTTCRYPTNRLSFYKYDSLEPYDGSHETWSDKRIGETIDSIVKRKKLPDYMKKSKKLKKVKFYYRRLKGLIASFASSNLIGEIYNTPTIKQKRAVEKVRCYNKVSYESNAIRSVKIFDSSNTLIFPLQMQPESNLDVWGYPYNSQAKILNELVGSLGGEWNILIKPNPKSKYEITKELLKILKQYENVYALSHHVPMEGLFDKFRYFFSITGTINHECLISKKYCFSPTLNINKKFASGVSVLPTPEIIANLSEVDESAPRRLIEFLVYNSFTGMIGDAVHTPQAFLKENVDNVVSAFRGVIRTKEANK